MNEDAKFVGVIAAFKKLVAEINAETSKDPEQIPRDAGLFLKRLAESDASPKVREQLLGLFVLVVNKRLEVFRDRETIRNERKDRDEDRKDRRTAARALYCFEGFAFVFIFAFSIYGTAVRLPADAISAILWATVAAFSVLLLFHVGQYGVLRDILSLMIGRCYRANDSSSSTINPPTNLPDESASAS